MEKTIYNLKLHEIYKINDFEYARRVPGGWTYSCYYNDGGSSISVSQCFVPYSEEFKPYPVKNS